MGTKPRPVEETSDRDKNQHAVDDEFRAVMEGIRTTIPGVMVLFSFLLILPLQASFSDFSEENKTVYYLAFASSALACVLLIAPSVHQLSRAPISGIRRHNRSHVMYAIKIALAGTVFFAIAVSAVVYLVSSFVFTDPLAIGATVVLAVVAIWAWFYLPVVRFNELKD